MDFIEKEEKKFIAHRRESDGKQQGTIYFSLLSPLLEYPMESCFKKGENL